MPSAIGRLSAISDLELRRIGLLASLLDRPQPVSLILVLVRALSAAGSASHPLGGSDRGHGPSPCPSSCACRGRSPVSPAQRRLVGSTILFRTSFPKSRSPRSLHMEEIHRPASSVDEEGQVGSEDVLAEGSKVQSRHGSRNFDQVVSHRVQERILEWVGARAPA